MKKRLFIIDAMAMAYQQFYALGPKLSARDGRFVSAVLGSANAVTKLLIEERPDYLLVASDSQDKTFRHEIYPEYKGNRKEMPRELAAQLSDFYALFSAMGIPVLKQKGLEADDFIGSVAKKFAGPDIDIYIVSGDKDFCQLVSDNIFLYSTKAKDGSPVIGREGVMAKFGCPPESVIDVLALMGDSSDNVPGVEGVGEKTAAKLISDFGSLEGIYEKIDALKGKQKEKLIASRDAAFLSRVLVTIKTDCEIPLTLDEIRCDHLKAIANEKVLAFYDELNFVELGKKARALVVSDSQTQPAHGTEAAPKKALKAALIVKSLADLSILEEAISSSDAFSFDTETTGLSMPSDVPVGASFAFPDGRSFYLPLHENHLSGDLSKEKVLESAKGIFEDERTIKIAHNAKFDLAMLSNVGLSVRGQIHDTMIMSHLLAPEQRQHGIDFLSESILGIKKILFKNLLKENDASSAAEVPLEKLGEYGAEDALCAILLYDGFRAQMEKIPGLWDLFMNVEMPLVPVLSAMEKEGIWLDSEEMSALDAALEKKEFSLEENIMNAAGEKFNLASPKQLQRILFQKLNLHETLGLKRLKRTKDGGFSTDESVLSKMTAAPIVQEILAWRSVAKLRSTYLQPLPRARDAKTGRIHTSFHQTGTVTGRLSSSDPNLQNIPIKSTEGKAIRKAFKAREGFAILSADYSQIELRILAHMSQDKILIDAFKSGGDVHRQTSSKILGVSPDEITKEQRDEAKAINYGIIYGMGAVALGAQIGKSTDEARSFIELYLSTHKGVKDFISAMHEKAQSSGEVSTILGRSRKIFEIDSKNEAVASAAKNAAVNSPVQGSAAELIKIAMINIHREMNEKGMKSKMLLQVHDELVFEVAKEEIEAMKELVTRNMETAMQLDVPLLVSIGVGPSWGEAH